MLEIKEIVINTGPLLALISALGDFSFLKSLYKRVLVPFEVCHEIECGGASGFGVDEFKKAKFIEKKSHALTIAPFLHNALDLGEAAVIQLALDEEIDTVCIDEAIGRRIARLNDLKLTGSIGILIRAKKRETSFTYCRHSVYPGILIAYLRQKVYFKCIFWRKYANKRI